MEKNKELLPNRLENLSKPINRLSMLLALSMFVFHVMFIFIYPLDAFITRSVFLSFVLSFVYLFYDYKGHIKKTITIETVIAICFVFSSSYYIYSQLHQIVFRAGVSPTSLDMFFGIILLILLLEATRRVMGYAIPIIAIFFIVYALYGNYFPAPLTIRGYGLDRIVSSLYSTSGIFNIPLGVASTYVYIFIFFGAMLQISKAGDTLMNISFAIAGGARGGPAKVAEFTSALFGMINGAAVANVVTTGTMTIPLMKRVGYNPRFAGAIEAVASTGGQLMPPIMGAGAFIMAEIIGVPYLHIAKAAIIPAILFFFTLFWVIDFEAVKCGLLGMDKNKLPKLFQILK